MKETHYFRGIWRSIVQQTDATGEKSLVFKAAHKGNKVDYANYDNLLDLSFNARKNANDLFNMVMEKYQGRNPVDVEEFEMLVALINLSSELYMKCLIYYHQLNQGKQCKGLHNLQDYFLKLPNDIQLDLKTIDDDFDMQLKNIANYFNEFRYNFEYNAIFAERFAFSFAEKLNQICNSIKIKRPAQVVHSGKRLLIKHGEKTVWDSSKNGHYNYPIVSKDD